MIRRAIVTIAVLVVAGFTALTGACAADDTDKGARSSKVYATYLVPPSR